MSSNRWSAAVPFDPDVPSFPPALEALFARPAATLPALLLIAGAEARRDGWAARAAIALAEAWAARGGRIVLADLQLEDPELHRLLGEPNGEGLVDVFEFGSSVARVARELPGHRFRFIAAGGYVPEPEAVLRHERWDRLIEEFAEDQATLLACVPVGAPGIEALGRRIGKAIALAGAGDEERLAALAVTTSVELVLGRRVEAAAAVPAGDDSADEDRWAAEPEPDLAPPPPDPVAGISVTDEQELTEPIFVHRPPRKRRRHSPLVWVVAAVIALLGGWIVVRRIGGEPAPRPPVEAGENETAPEVVAPVGEPAGATLPFSVAIEAHLDYATAQERIAALRRDEPRLTFYLAPIPHDSLIYYRVLAGPIADTTAARALMQYLVDAGQKTGMDEWAIRPTAWAFQIGEFQDRQAAAVRASELDAQGLPTYIVEVPYTVGPPRFRVYAGAYESRNQAEVMAQLLETAGISASLVRRSGKPAE